MKYNDNYAVSCDALFNNIGIALRVVEQVVFNSMTLLMDLDFFYKSSLSFG